ncbi:MAG: hypothetical protein JNK42_05705 [Caedimonas sp.]|jgi:hypothetical protein|nr:hypothetical protein [Caedimonas sp.]
MKRSTVLFLMLATFLGVATYLVKQSVMSIEQDLLLAQKEIFQLEESIHLLKAEWSHLNEPGRLQKLVENHLNCCSVEGIKLVSIDKVPSKQSEQEDRVRQGKPEPLSKLTLASAAYMR